MLSQAECTNDLREEIAEMYSLLFDTIEEMAGSESLRVIRELHELCGEHRKGDQRAHEALADCVQSLDEEQMRVVIRAFSLLLDVTNLAEDRQRIRVLCDRANAAWPTACDETIESALLQLKAAGCTAAEVQTILDGLAIEPVFTAHPTEAKRRSIRGKLRKIRELLDEVRDEPLRSEHERGRTLLRSEFAKLWFTDFIRPWRPTVLQEVARGLAFKPVLWQVVPDVLAEIRSALANVFPDDTFDVRPCITFGSWIGGDRDGHPDVTSEVTGQTFIWLRETALELHLSSCDELYYSLSLSKRQMPLGEELEVRIKQSVEDWSELQDQMVDIPPNEVCRRWLAVIRWRLEQTQSVSLDGQPIRGAYTASATLDADVKVLHDAVSGARGGGLLAAEVHQWLDQIRIFGFHLARLDVRQDSRDYLKVVDEILAASGLKSSETLLSEVERQQLLCETLEQPIDLNGLWSDLSEQAHETILLFRLLRQVATAFGDQAIGGHVISMTHQPSDVLTVLWFWQQTRLESAPSPSQAEPLLHIVPLFETIDDLHRGSEILGVLLETPKYRDYLSQMGDRQTVMLGYSDSTKDGGYLAACWSLYEAQKDLYTLGASRGVRLTFFHGRGGSLGRGGGPTARSILSLPAHTFHGALRLTEQGEVLADRYDDPRIASRHLEQLMWSSLLASGMPSLDVPDQWLEVMHELSKQSFVAYRALVEQPGFVDFFRRATPISEVEQLPIGSRPARRAGGTQLSDLRAIPWVFSWTQARCLVPAWYGIGAALQPLLADPQQQQVLRTMHSDWPFFRATIENAELALAKTDLHIAEHYAELADQSERTRSIGTRISAEYERSREAILAVTQSQELLDGTPWLQDSIQARSQHIDPLNLLQIELLRRLAECDPQDSEEIEELRHLTRLSINGLAAGMRTSG